MLLDISNVTIFCLRTLHVFNQDQTNPIFSEITRPGPYPDLSFITLMLLRDRDFSHLTVYMICTILKQYLEFVRSKNIKNSYHR